MSATTNGKLGETSNQVLSRFLAMAYRQYVHPSFHVVRPPRWSVGRSILVETWRRRKLFAAYARLFHRELSLSPSRAIHPYGGNKAPNKRFRADGPNVRMENPILACRAARLVRVPSLLIASPHPPYSVLSFDPSTSRLPLHLSTHTILLFSHSPLLLHVSSSVSSRTHSHIHRNWSLTTAKHYHIPIKITSSLLQILFLSLSFSAISPFPLPRDTSRFSSRKWTFPHILFRRVEKDCA